MHVHWQDFYESRFMPFSKAIMQSNNEWPQPILDDSVYSANTHCAILHFHISIMYWLSYIINSIWINSFRQRQFANNLSLPIPFMGLEWHKSGIQIHNLHSLFRRRTFRLGLQQKYLIIVDIQSAFTGFMNKRFNLCLTQREFHRIQIRVNLLFIEFIIALSITYLPPKKLCFKVQFNVLISFHLFAMIVFKTQFIALFMQLFIKFQSESSHEFTYQLLKQTKGLKI